MFVIPNTMTVNNKNHRKN